jgi:uncharacterized membrane protein HdeD (DUF308 family)
MAYTARNPIGTTADIVGTRDKWIWFVVLGAALLFVAALAFSNLLMATVASIYFIGAMMLLGGITEIIHAFSVQTWSGFFVWLLSGAAYALAGCLAFLNPVLASVIMTLLLAVSLIVSGSLRIWIGFASRPGNLWGWILAGGVLTLLTGIAVAAVWPGSSLWVLGLLLAVDLAAQGIACIAFGVAVRSRNRAG